MDLSREHACALDAADPLRDLRAQFSLPRDARGECLIYLAGHSLGLAPVTARAAVEQALEDWERLGVRGHEQARRPWIDYAEALHADLAQLLGAQSDEVVAMNSLSVNLHLLMAGFYRPSATRYRILIEAGAFPSDRYAMRSQLAHHGIADPTALIELAPRAGECALRAGDIDAAIAEAGDSLALVLWPGVQYLTGQAFDVAAIAASAHRVGAVAGFDLAHAIGNVPLALHDAEADFAVWCSYKYLNAGPGALGGAFVHRRHTGRSMPEHLTGWWGHERASRFQMPERYLAAPGAAAWALSNPPILSAAPLRASLQLLRRAGMAALRAKSTALTGYLESLLQARCGTAVRVLTPAEASARGAQLTLQIEGGTARARAILAQLERSGVVADWREPGLIRVAPTPSYNRYEEAWLFVASLADALGRTPAA